MFIILDVISFYAEGGSLLQVEGQTIRANVLLQRKREKVNRKYTQTVSRGRQLSPGFLEEALDEVYFYDTYDSTFDQ